MTALTRDWREDAACTTADLDLWIPPTEYERVPSGLAAICGACTVADDCLADALANPVHGVRAGTTLGQRQRMAPGVRQTIEHRGALA